MLLPSNLANEINAHVAALGNRLLERTIYLSTRHWLKLADFLAAQVFQVEIGLRPGARGTGHQIAEDNISR